MSSSGSSAACWWPGGWRPGSASSPLSQPTSIFLVSQHILSWRLAFHQCRRPTGQPFCPELGPLHVTISLDLHLPEHRRPWLEGSSEYSSDSASTADWPYTATSRMQIIDYERLSAGIGARGGRKRHRGCILWLAHYSKRKLLVLVTRCGLESH